MEDDTTRSKEIFIRTWTTENQRIHIGIKNTGPRIPADIQAKIFDPFFTTKPIGSGTGLGLAISYQTMKKHKGNIQINSEDASGTEFIIDLPIGKNLPITNDLVTANSLETLRLGMSGLEPSNNQTAA